MNKANNEAHLNVGDPFSTPDQLAKYFDVLSSEIVEIIKDDPEIGHKLLVLVLFRFYGRMNIHEFMEILEK